MCIIAKKQYVRNFQYLEILQFIAYNVIFIPVAEVALTCSLKSYYPNIDEMKQVKVEKELKLHSTLGDKQQQQQQRVLYLFPFVCSDQRWSQRK